MSQFSIEVEDARAHALLREAPRRLLAAQRGAVNDTVKQVKAKFAKLVAGEVRIKQRDVKRSITVRRARGSDDTPGGAVRLAREDRFSLKRFDARQLGKGVKYGIGKAGGRKLIPGAFGPNIPKLGGHVFVRQHKDRPLPIIKKFGVSPWGVIVHGEGDKLGEVVLFARAKFRVNIQRRIAHEFRKLEDVS